MARIRVQLEVLAVAVVLVMLLGATVSRTLVMADHSQARSFATTGAHFVAGIEMVQAESRLAQRRKLNAAGYPTGESGVLSNDTDCALIWQEAMREGSAVIGTYVADSDGGGDRCEFLIQGATAASSMRILYWPTGVAAASVSLGKEMIRVTRGAHVHVTVHGVSS